MNKRFKSFLGIIVCLTMLLASSSFALDETPANITGEAPEAPSAATETQSDIAADNAKNTATEGKEIGSGKKAAKSPKKTDKPADHQKKESLPAFSRETSLDGVKIVVTAAKDVFPDGAKLSVQKVSKDAQKKVDKAVDEAREDDLNVASAYTFDVKILDKNGKEVQPADQKKAEVSFSLAEAGNPNLDVAVYHLKETRKGLRAEALKTGRKQGIVSAETEGFSYYTVEFSYGGLQYTMNGDSSVALADILKRVGLEGEVSAVRVSNDKLFSAEKKDGKWTVTAHQAFSSAEWIKVTLAGVTYEIAVTDDQTLPGTVNTDLNLAAGSVYDGTGTVGVNITKGPIRGPQGGTATINNYFVSNKASNDFGGGANAKGSAFIARGADSLAFDTVSIDSRNMNSLIFNIWASSSISAKNTTITGRDYAGAPFLLVGAYPKGTAGTLNFSGTSAINDMKITSICGGNNSSVINVASGTLTVKDCEIAMKDGVRFVVKNGATLVLDNTDLDVTDCSAVAAITVENGGKLTLKNGSSVKASENKAFNKGIIVSDGGDVEILNSEISGITNTAESSLIDVKNGGSLTVTDSAFKNNKSGQAVIRVVSSEKIQVDGTSEFKNNAGGTYGGALWVSKTPVTIGDDVTFEKNTARFGGAIYLQECAGVQIGKTTFKGNGTIFTGSDWPAIQTQDGGALYIREGSAELNGTVFEENIAATSSNSSGGAAYIYNAVVDIKGAKFKENTSLIYGGALTVAHGSRVNIGDLNGDPAEFKDNLVEYGTDQAGGALFINNAYVKMMDAAIYGNAAEDAGGGLSTCTTGTAEVRVLDGAAIFNNSILSGNHEHGSGSYPPVDDIQNYKDVYFQTVDHKDADTGEDIPGRDGFPSYAYELYERMFNGGLHNWSAKPANTVNDQGKTLNSLVAQSNPTNTDVSGAKVVFTGNQAWRHPSYAQTVSGGAIGCNGLLEIGTSTEIKIVKLWDDDKNALGLRPSKKDFLKSVKILANGTEVDKSGLLIDVITENADKYVLYNNVVSADGKPVDFGGKEPWLIIVSGLPKATEGSDDIVYTIEETALSNYTQVSAKGDMQTFFELENKVQPKNIPPGNDDSGSDSKPAAGKLIFIKTAKSVDTGDDTSAAALLAVFTVCAAGIVFKRRQSRTS